MASASDLFSGVPAGVILPYGGTSTPAGWLLAYGQAVSRTTYSALFAALGTTYGAGDGSTTFNLPDMRGRAPFGKDDMGGSAAGRLNNTDIDGGTSNPDGTTLGATGGDDRTAIVRVSDATIGGTGTRVIDVDNVNGSGDASNVPPAIVLNYIVKA